MFKKIVAGIMFILAFIAGLLFRRNTNRSGIQSSDDSINRIGNGIDSARDNNKSAADGIRTAKNILERAKERTDSGNN